MAKVIDRLRIQGISPSREISFSSREELIRPPVVPNPQTDKSWIPNGDGFCMTSQRHSKEFLSSSANPAARRAEVLMRMHTANQGISTMDSHFGSAPVQFMCRGQHVKNQSEKAVSTDSIKLLPDKISPPQRPFTQDNNTERQIKVHIGKARSEPVTGAMVDKESRESRSKDDSSLPSFTSPSFMLGPTHPPSYRATYTPRRTARSSEEGFELTGQRMKGFAGLSRSGFSDRYPHIETPPRSQRRWTRNLFKDTPSPFATSDPQVLNRCLRVHQSIRLPLGTQDEAIKLKHFTQFVKKDGKVSFNNPYRKVKRKNRRALSKSDSQYQFDSVSSYIHFNRIYQQPTSDRSVVMHVPQMTGFPAHCTDTVLLRMMFEMNKPPRKSPDKYSDVAVQRDLEEYLMVRTPSAFSKAASAHSKKTGRNKSGRSGRSNTELEEKGTCAWAGNKMKETDQKQGDNTNTGKEREEVVGKEEIAENQQVGLEDEEEVEEEDGQHGPDEQEEQDGQEEHQEVLEQPDEEPEVQDDLYEEPFDADEEHASEEKEEETEDYGV